MNTLREFATSPWFTWMVIAVEAVIIVWLLFTRKSAQQS